MPERCWNCGVPVDEKLPPLPDLLRQLSERLWDEGRQTESDIISGILYQLPEPIPVLSRGYAMSLFRVED